MWLATFRRAADKQETWLRKGTGHTTTTSRIRNFTEGGPEARRRARKGPEANMGQLTPEPHRALATFPRGQKMTSEAEPVRPGTKMGQCTQGPHEKSATFRTAAAMPENGLGRRLKACARAPARAGRSWRVARSRRRSRKQRRRGSQVVSACGRARVGFDRIRTMSGASLPIPSRHVAEFACVHPQVGPTRAEFDKIGGIRARLAP